MPVPSLKPKTPVEGGSNASLGNEYQSVPKLCYNNICSLNDKQVPKHLLYADIKHSTLVKFSKLSRAFIL